MQANLIQKSIKVHDQSEQITGKKSFKRLRRGSSLFERHDHLFKCQIPPTKFHAVVFTTLVFFLALYLIFPF